MKIAVVGKGGSGKTTTSAVLARSPGPTGRPAWSPSTATPTPTSDCRWASATPRTERLVTLREEVDEGESEHAPTFERHPRPLRRRRPRRCASVGDYPYREPGARLTLMRGWSAEQLLGSVNDEATTVVADLEAGIGTLTRLADSSVDATVVVVEPTLRSIDVARRAVTVAEEQRQGPGGGGGQQGGR